MKKYRCIKIGKTDIETENILNKHAEIGWELVCSYLNGMYLILVKQE